jgi:hypothetical protein
MKLVSYFSEFKRILHNFLNLQEFEINQENDKKSKAIEPNLAGTLAHSSARPTATGPAWRLAQLACGPQPYRAGLAQRPAGTSRCWQHSHTASRVARGAAPAVQGCGQVTLNRGLNVVLGKGSVAQGADTAETSPARKPVADGAPGELVVAAAVLWLSVRLRRGRGLRLSLQL